MARTQTMVQLSEDLLERLDRKAARTGSSRSSLIRDLLWDGLRRDEEALIGQRIAAGYRRVPQGEPDDWGDLALTAESSTEDLLRRLNAEEKHQGRTAW